MNVQIQSVKFDAGQQLLDFIQKKMDRLVKTFVILQLK